MKRWRALTIPFVLAVVTVLTSCEQKFERSGGAKPEPTFQLPRPDSILLENLTSNEVADFLADGYTQIIVPTAGLEQNGPFIPLNKHKIIATAFSERIARKLGKTLVAPAIDFVPEGPRSPAAGHMRFAGTISVDEEVFVALVKQVVESLAAHGFRSILLVADSAGNLAGLEQVTKSLRGRFGKDVHVRFIQNFYSYPALRKSIRDWGYEKEQNPYHEELAFTAQLAVFAPQTLHLQERIAMRQTQLSGFDLQDLPALKELGEKLIALREQLVIEELAKVPTE